MRSVCSVLKNDVPYFFEQDIELREGQQVEAGFQASTLERIGERIRAY